MKRIFSLLTVLAFTLPVSLPAQYFAKYFTFGPSNPFAGTSFLNSHELKDSSGFLILGDKYINTYRNGFVIKTDTALNEIWTTSLNFQNAQFPYENINFYDIGELLNGNIYVLGVAGPGGTSPHYVLFVLDTAGQIINYTALHDAQNNTNGNYISKISLCEDSTILIPVSEAERFGYYRVDQNLNLVSSAFYTYGTLPGGRDCIMLHDSTLLINSANGLIKTDITGNVLWSRTYTGFSHIFSLYESPSGSIYASASAYSTTSNAALAKFDSAGNPVFLKLYNMAPFTTTSAAWQIYEFGNDIMVYSDSVMFRVDTNGTVIGWGKSVAAYNNKVMKPGLDDKFILTGQIMQDNTGWYEYSLMKFDDSTQSGCLHPRAIVTTVATTTTTTLTVQQQSSQIVRDTINFFRNAVNLDFDTFDGCPPNPLTTGEEESVTQLTCFPNPASGTIQFSASCSTCAGVTLEVFDVQGKLIAAQTGEDVNTAIDVSGWGEGLYLAVFRDEAGIRGKVTFVVAR